MSAVEVREGKPMKLISCQDILMDSGGKDMTSLIKVMSIYQVEIEAYVDKIVKERVEAMLPMVMPSPKAQVRTILLL